MALASPTSLNGSISMNAQQVRLTAFTNPASGGISAPTKLLVDGEVMYVSDASLSPVLSVSRGQEGTAASAHNTLAPVVYGLTSDFTQQASTNGVVATPYYSYGADATVTNPINDTVIYITKASACALTITDPNKDALNKVTFVSLTAAAHTLTYATGFYGNTTSSDLVTFPSTIGAEFTMRAKNGAWNAEAAVNTGGITGPS